MRWELELLASVDPAFRGSANQVSSTRCEDCSVTVVVHEPSVLVWFGPLLLFVASMVTLIFTIRSANKREWIKWRRDTLVKLCSDAVTAAQEASVLCESALSQETHVFAEFNLTSASKSAARIGTIAEQLYLIGANHLAGACLRMRAAADAINLPSSHLRTARIDAGSLEERELKRKTEGPSSVIEDGSANPEYRSKIADTRQRIHQDTVAEHEKRYTAARDELEAVRAGFIERGRTELKSGST